MKRTGGSQEDWIEEAARLICDEGYADYRAARAKAAERLGISPRSSPPDPRRIEAAVLQRHALFDAAAHALQLAAMRRTALRAMRLLSGYQPRLAGSSVTGAIGEGHRVQLHLVADMPETVEMLLHDRHIPFEQGERRYRLADGRDFCAALLSFEADTVGVDLAVFEPASLRHPPLSQIDGKPARRLTCEQLEALIAAAAD